jgi:hypothetical protein
MSFTAQYNGSCAECGGNLKGKECRYNGEDEIVHVTCPDHVDPMDDRLGRHERLCGTCFTIHAGECP